MRLQALFDRAVQDERLVAIGLCSLDGKLLRQHRAAFRSTLDCQRGADRCRAAATRGCRLAGGPVHVGVHPVDGETGADRQARAAARPELHRPAQPGHAALPDPLHRRRSALAIALITWSSRSSAGAAGCPGARALLRGEGLLRPMARRRPNWRRSPPSCARACATWRTSTGASQGPQTELGRRAPARAAAHAAARRPGHRRLEPRALHPRARADGGIVVRAAGERPGDRGRAGDAGLLGHLDRARQRQRRPRRRSTRTTASRVPPGHDEYMLRRIWLSAEEEQGYYYGFANEGMWPLCHVAHVRPVFRESRLAAVPRRQPALRRRGGRRGAQRGSGRAGAGLPLRAAAGDGPREAAARRPS